MAILVLLEATAKAECVSKMKDMLKELFPETRTYDGCQGLTAYLNADDGRTFVFVGYWDTKDAYQRYLAWRTETGVLAQLSSMLEGAPSIRYFETVDA